MNRKLGRVSKRSYTCQCFWRNPRNSTSANSCEFLLFQEVLPKLHCILHVPVAAQNDPSVDTSTQSSRVFITQHPCQMWFSLPANICYFDGYKILWWVHNFITSPLGILGPLLKGFTNLSQKFPRDFAECQAIEMVSGEPENASLGKVSLGTG